MQNLNNMKAHTPKISVISPEYKGEKMVRELVERNINALKNITENFEIILVKNMIIMKTLCMI